MSQRNIKCVERRVILTGISWRKMFDADHEIFKILLVKVKKKKHSLFESKTKRNLPLFHLPTFKEQHIINPKFVVFGTDSC